MVGSTTNKVEEDIEPELGVNFLKKRNNRINILATFFLQNYSENFLVVQRLHILRSDYFIGMKKLRPLKLQKCSISDAFKGLQRKIAFFFHKHKNILQRYSVFFKKRFNVYCSIYYFTTHIRSYPV
jgi:hypothetical protein